MALLLPIVYFAFRPSRSTLFSIAKGLLLTFFGVTLLLHGVHIGFIMPGRSIGAAIGSLQYKWLAIPIGALIGFVAVMAEPAVQVLCSQVDEQKKILGIAIEPEKDIILIVVGREITDKVLLAIIKEGHLDQPNTGIAFAIELSKGSVLCICCNRAESELRKATSWLPFFFCLCDWPSLATPLR